MQLHGNEAIVAAGRVLTGFSAAGEAEFLDDGAIRIFDGRIAEVGPRAALARTAPHVPVERHDGAIMLPGLVNSHHHVGLTPLQMGTLDHPLELWIGSGVARRKLAPYLDTLFSAIEMLKSGVTTVQHIQGAMRGPAENMHGVAREILRAYGDIGMRVSFCFNARDQNRLAYEPDETFLARLPVDLRPYATGFLAQRSVTMDDYLALFDQLREDTKDEARTGIQLAPANLHWCSDDGLRAMQEKARAAGVPMHMHLVETVYQRHYARKRTGMTAVGHLHRLGLLGPHMTLGHGVWLDGDDIDILAETGTCICHNCSSNMRLGSGHAPVTTFLERGIPVALGIDEAGINDDRDMLLEMRLVLYRHRAPGHGSRWPSASEVLHMATEGGARTVTSSAPLGRLAPGAAADFVLVDEKRAFRPYQDANVPLPAALLQRVKPSAIDAVHVGGACVVRDGRLTSIDEDAVLDEIAAALAAPRDAEEEANLAFARRIVPILRDYYAGSL